MNRMETILVWLVIFGVAMGNAACGDDQAAPNACDEGAKRCQGNGVVTCFRTENELAWSSVEACPGETPICSNAMCTAEACSSVCTGGETQCDGVAGEQTCVDTNGDGCFEWSATMACGAGAECIGNACVACTTVSSWTQKNVTGPAVRSNHAMAYDSARGEVVLFGGNNSNQGLLGDTWIWNGTTWEQKNVAGPAARSDHAMAYDSARGEVVLFGGQVVGFLGDTWIWNGATWEQKNVAGPEGRSDHAMAYDSARGEVVLFGGIGTNNRNGNFLSDTWIWNGTTWEQKNVAGPASAYHAMAYDSARGEVILNWAYSGGAWVWDGTMWTRSNVAGPGSRRDSALVYDNTRGEIVLFGGVAGMTNLGDTWIWDGTSWAKKNVAGPVARGEHAMAYDSARGEVVLLGGGSGISAKNDTWVYKTDCQPL